MIKYYYDELGQVTREDNGELGKTIVYTYDKSGHILKTTEYALVSGTSLGTPTKTNNYGYNDVNWKDKLTSYNGKTITYDAIGNPTTYDGYTFRWEAGRSLKYVNGNGKNIEYKYNIDGIRTGKIVDGIKYNYTLEGNNVVYEEINNGSTTDKIIYNYGDSGLVGFTLNNTEYFYIRNAQSDIIGIIDSNGTQVVSYTYDTWGKLISIDGTLKDTVGVKNPYRYRGYRYDSEIGLYYLNSRYYNPEWGRFLNADGLTSTGQGFIGNNMFVYCLNNPASNKDNNGYLSHYVMADGGGRYTKTPSDSGEVQKTQYSIPNLFSAISGSVIEAVGNISKTCKAYLNNGVMNLYPDSSIAQKIMPYASATKKISKAFMVVTTALDVGRTWDPDVNMSTGQRIGKTALQLVGIGAAFAVGYFVTGPIIAAGMAAGGVTAAVYVIGAGLIDFAAGTAIGWGQNTIYKKCGME